MSTTWAPQELGPSPGGVSVRRRPHAPGVPIAYAALSADPEESAATARDAGFEAGYEHGLARAQEEAQEADRRTRARADQAMGALENATRDATAALADRQRELEHQATALAYELLEILLGRELALARDPGRDAVARALAMDPSNLPATVRIHPDDAAVLGDASSLGQNRAVTVVADPSVEPGGALVEIGESTIDSQLSAALQRVRDLLMPEGEEARR